MALKFTGELSAFQLICLENDLRGQWSSPKAGTHKYSLEGGGYVTWHASTGAVQIQADPGHIRPTLEGALSPTPPTPTLDAFFE